MLSKTGSFNKIMWKVFLPMCVQNNGVFTVSLWSQYFGSDSFLMTLIRKPYLVIVTSNG